MLYDFKSHIDELRNSDYPENRSLIEGYEKLYGPMGDDITKQIWYVDYISKFFPYYKNIKCPDELNEDYDWKLLFALTVGSFSSTFELVSSKKFRRVLDEPVDLKITVKSGEKCITKTLEELWSFQISRLFEIYVEEQIALQKLIGEEHESVRNLWEERLEKIKYFSNYYDDILRMTESRGGEDGKNKEQMLYHYTSYETLQKILDTKSLRACDISKLNDRREFKICFEVFQKAVNKFREMEDADTYNEMLEQIVNEVNSYKKFDYYVTCFSRERDLLSQWQMYGDSCMGLCLVFDKNEILHLLYENNKCDRDECDILGLLNGDLEYDYKGLCSDLIKKIGEILTSYLDSGLSCKEYLNRVDNLGLFKEECERIFMRMQDAKDASFYAEKEFRLWWLQLRDRPIKDEFRFTRSSRMIVPYVNLSFGSQKLPIKEVILGPGFENADEKVEELKEDFERMGYSGVLVSKSRIPYRR